MITTRPIRAQHDDDLPVDLGESAALPAIGYDHRHTLYTQLTVTGDPARAVLARIAAEYRDLT